MLRSIVITVALALLLLASCNGSSTHAPLIAERDETGESTPEVPWPPNDALARSASDDVVTMFGRDYAETGGQTVVEGSHLKLGPGGFLTWAIYSLQGFGDDVTLSSLSADYADAPGGTRLYFGLADYTKDRWHWLDLTPLDAEFDVTDFSPFISPGGAVHVAVVKHGSNFGRVRHLRFERTGAGANVPVPSGLAGEPLPGRIHLSWDAAEFVDGYYLYRATDADFTDEARVKATPISSTEYDDTSVTAHTDYWYRLTAIRSDQESAKSTAIQVTSGDLAPVSPLNLKATTDVGKVTLTWTPSFGATSYILQRSTRPDFSPRQQFFTAAPLYIDQSVDKGRFYYYRVISVAVHNSAPSPYVEAFVPQVDLPAPENWRVDAAGGDFVKFGWDWPFEVEPGAFRIWLHFDPDFYFDGRQIPLDYIFRTWRSYYKYDLPPNTTFYARIAAYDAEAKIGRVSPAIEFTTGELWDWDDVVEIVAGGAPMELVSDPGGLTMAYRSGSAIRAARREGDVWTSNINIGINTGRDEHSMLEMVYGDDQNLILSNNLLAVGTTGTGFALEFPLIDRGGYYASLAVSEEEYAVLHYRAPLDLLDPDNPPPPEDLENQLWISRRPAAGGPWQMEMIEFLPFFFLESAIAYHDGALNMLMYDPLTSNLMKFTDADFYDRTRANPVDGDGIGIGVQLHPFGDKLITPAVSGVTNSIYSMIGDAHGGFETENLIGNVTALSQIDIAVSGERALITYVRLNYPIRMFYSERVSEGNWETGTISLPGLHSNVLRVEAFEDEFYIVYLDDDGIYRCARGIEPQ